MSGPEGGPGEARVTLPRAGTEVLVLSGPQGRARVPVAGGVEVFEADGVGVMRGLIVEDLPSGDGEAGPSMTTRTLGAGQVQERIFLTPDVPALVLEWTAERGGRAPLELHWSVPGAVRWRASGPVLTVRLGRDRVARFATGSDAAWWTARQDRSDPAAAADLHVRVRIPWSGEERIQLVASLSSEGGRQRSRVRSALRHLKAQHVRAVATTRDRGQAELHIRSDDATLGAGLDWAACRMPPLSGPFPGAEDRDARTASRLLQGLGAVALGRFTAAAPALEGAGSEARALLTRWRGDLASGRSEPGGETLDQLLDSTRGGALIQLRRADSSGTPSGTPTTGPLDVWLWGWRAFDRGQAEAAHQALGELVGLGFGGAPGTWRAGGIWGDPTLTALVPATMVFGMLGARADAWFGRLTLSPQLPGAARWLTAANLRCGPSLVTMRYDRDGGSHRFRLLQTRGAVPLDLVFEPSVPVSGISRVQVDGQEADLEVFTRGERTGVRVHLPLDQERSIVIVGSG